MMLAQCWPLMSAIRVVILAVQTLNDPCKDTKLYLTFSLITMYVHDYVCETFYM